MDNHEGRLPEVLTIIPARGGSKGLPGKNVRLLGGHPLIAWSVACGRLAKSVTRVICSTDDTDIANAARRYGAEVPFIRPAELASDTATDLDVFRHALGWLREHEDYQPDLVVQLRPTTPFRESGWIDECVSTILADQDLSCVRSVGIAPQTPYKMWVFEGSVLRPLLTLEGKFEPYNSPRQDLPAVYWHTGQMDVIRPAVILSGSMTGSHIAPLFVDTDRAIDIDTARDFQMAELAFGSLMPSEFQSFCNRSPRYLDWP
jgi:CMP-N,N'-diacetyllegionaminic acid synthase